jgi:hypothetical protein
VIGDCLLRMPDGETGIRQSWIKFLQDALASHPAIEVAHDIPPFKFTQWDGKVVREIPRLRLLDPDALDADAFASGYSDMALASWRIFEALQRAGVIPEHIKFQICIPSPIAPTYNNMLPEHRPAVLDALIRHFCDQVARIAAEIPPDRIAIQWDVCQEVLAWEGYYDAGPVDFRTETVNTLVQIGQAVPEPMELGFHLCYGSPQDEHLVQPKDAGVMVDLVNSVAGQLSRALNFIHFPVPKVRTDDGYFEPFERLAIDSATERYLGLIHYQDEPGDSARLAAARRHLRVDGVATECGMGRGDPGRLASLLEAHASLAALR